jgi:predicted nuclease of predicted toxin-antitoxin system
VTFLLDLNIPISWVQRFEQAGWRAVHWSSVGALTAPDRELIERAAQHGWIVVTHDLDLATILASSGAIKPSVIQVRADDLRADASGAIVIEAIKRVADELAKGAVVTVEPGRSRVTLLPFRQD